MQYHLNGYRPGDPAIAPAADERSMLPPEEAGDDTDVDVLIVGCGPAGLTLAAQLAAFPSIRTRIVERKPGPLQVGQADGIACRSMEMFEAFGFAEKVVKESYWVNETTFWRPGAEDGSGIRRANRIQDVEDGLSEFPHTILNQARVHDFFLATMRESPTRLEPDYHRGVTGLRVDRDPKASHPVEVTLERADPGHEGEIERVRARYVVGCDGARSAVRKALGHALVGDSANKVWGVMDVLAVTDFPDIRLKAAIQSASAGSMLIIPREGGYLVRLYIELDSLARSERVADRHIGVEQLIEAAGRILHPYTLDVKEVAWWSAYEIGQRVADSFDDVAPDEREHRAPRVFIAGDACHTHSPKAGQGMNVSMADAFNLGWKLASVLLGQADAKLLHTYSAERRAKAQELIDFDRDMARLFSAKPQAGAGAGAGADPATFQQYFAKHGRYTAGVETRYDASMIVAAATHQALARGFVVGKRFHSAPVVRAADAKPMQLGHVMKADGRWRLVAFEGRRGAADGSPDVQALCEFLVGAPDSPVVRCTPAGADVDAVFDLRLVSQVSHRDLDLSSLPRLLQPRKGRHGLVDYEKVFCADLRAGQDIFDSRGIDRERGGLVVVRPDQYVAAVLPLRATDELAAFFAAFMKPAR
jgi:2-polyprenyl-6-methoxyphenol hydroxylase-like FAD-dependent oxidoreductase